jgi:uncharacterized RDD family membrane protein YckC
MEYSVLAYAGFWKRFIAMIIDQIIMGIINTIIFIPIFIMFGLSVFPWENLDDFNRYSIVQHRYDMDDEFTIAVFFAFFGVIILLSFVSTIIQWLYFALMESSAKQATLGKMALGIKVTDMMGNRISFGRATGRYFGKIISGLILYIGFIMAGFTEKKQALHDIMASCLVVNN